MNNKRIYPLCNDKVLTVGERKKLAVKTKNNLVAMTGGNYEIRQIDDDFTVNTLLGSDDGTIVFISYIIAKDGTWLNVIISNCKCSMEYLIEKIQAAKLDAFIRVMEMEGLSFALHISMPLETIGHEEFIIVRKVDTILNIVTEAVNEYAK